MKTPLFKKIMLTLVLFSLVTLPTSAQRQGETTSKSKIQWFGNWKQGLAEAKRTGRPILLTSAAPKCRGISGLW